MSELGSLSPQDVSCTLAAPCDADDSFLEVSLGYTGINPHTGLANDFLNQYNEIIILIEHLPIDLEVVEEINDWRPLSYTEHFEASGLSDTQRVLQAYALAPAGAKKRFARALDDLNHMLSKALSSLVTAAKSDSQKSESLRTSSATLATEVRTQADTLKTIISAHAPSRQTQKFADLRQQIGVAS
jgi:hypothetical protein